MKLQRKLTISVAAIVTAGALIGLATIWKSGVDSTGKLVRDSKAPFSVRNQLNLDEFSENDLPLTYPAVADNSKKEVQTSPNSTVIFFSGDGIGPDPAGLLQQAQSTFDANQFDKAHALLHQIIKQRTYGQQIEDSDLAKTAALLALTNLAAGDKTRAERQWSEFARYCEQQSDPIYLWAAQRKMDLYLRSGDLVSTLWQHGQVSAMQLDALFKQIEADLSHVNTRTH